MISKNLQSKDENEKAYGAARSLEIVYRGKPPSPLMKEGFNDVQYLEDRLLDTQLIISVNDTDILITIPGTDGKGDIMTDISGAYLIYKWTLKKRGITGEAQAGIENDMKIAVKQSKTYNVGLPHFGFYFSAWRLFRTIEIEKTLQNAGVDKKKLTICGHSLGAAIAQHFANILRSRGIQADNVYTFGGPAPARKKFKKHFEKSFPNARSYIHESDIVPYAAPMFMGFKRVRREFFIDTKNNIVEVERLKLFDKRRFKGRKRNKKFDPIHDHFMPEYVHGLKP
jgi:hypothetical protein